MQVVILCGGKGLRAWPLTEEVPKPMLPVGGRPILEHLMQLFADQGHCEFVLAVGYRQEVIRDYFFGTNRKRQDDWRIDIVDTGEDADTGERLRGCAPVLRETFLATYGDGLCDVPLDALLAFHTAHGGLATLTSVPLDCQYGIVEADAQGRVLSFREKPVLREHWINAGFMVMERGIFGQWPGPNLERDVLPSLAQRGQVYTFHHEGFFKALDSAKDQQELDQLLRTGRAPWSVAPLA
jgi:glucose-1-phosphate cytidylyltransferase